MKASRNEQTIWLLCVAMVRVSVWFIVCVSIYWTERRHAFCLPFYLQTMTRITTFKCSKGDNDVTVIRYAFHLLSRQQTPVCMMVWYALPCITHWKCCILYISLIKNSITSEETCMQDGKMWLTLHCLELRRRIVTYSIFFSLSIVPGRVITYSSLTSLPLSRSQ